MSFAGHDIVAILKFPFQDKQWVSKLVFQGALLVFLSFFLVGIPFLVGFFFVMIKRAIANDPNLPDWNEWGSYWHYGWRGIVVNVIYLLPIWIIWFGILCAFLASIILTNYDEAFAWLFLPTGLLALFTYMLTFIYILVLTWLVQPVYYPLIALDAPLKNCFRLKTYIWPYIKVNIGNMIIAMLIAYLAGLVAGVGMFFFFIGYFFTLPYAMAITARVNGLVYRQSPIQYNA